MVLRNECQSYLLDGALEGELVTGAGDVGPITGEPVGEAKTPITCQF